MSSDQVKSNLQSIDRSKISEEKIGETSADVKKNLGLEKASETGAGNLNLEASDIGQSKESITAQGKLNEPEVGLGQESEKNLLKSNEGQKEEHTIKRKEFSLKLEMSFRMCSKKLKK